MKICYFDRDGIINNHLPYVGSWERFHVHEEIIPIMQYFQKNNYRIIVITNQSGIGRGFYTLKEFYRLSFKMINMFEDYGINLEVRYCPHTPEDNCRCRKQFSQKIY